MINSKQKGSKGEREWAKFCREQGYDVRRSQQYNGMAEGEGDCVGLPHIYQEVKRVQNINVTAVMERVIQDAGDGDMWIPIVAWRKDRGRWYVAMKAEDWFMMYREWEAGEGEE